LLETIRVVPPTALRRHRRPRRGTHAATSGEGDGGPLDEVPDLRHLIARRQPPCLARARPTHGQRHALARQPERTEIALHPIQHRRSEHARVAAHDPVEIPSR